MNKSVSKFILGAVAVTCLGLPVAAVQQQEGTPPPPSDSGNDPFYRKPKPVKVPVEKDANKPVPIPFPPYEQRKQDYLRSRDEAKARGLPEPSAIGQYLVSELAVIGVYETDGSSGAFIVATPTNTTFFVGPGTRVYNGEIVAVNTGQNFDLGQVVFRQLTKYRVKKKEQDVVDMVTKPVASPKK